MRKSNFAKRGLKRKGSRFLVGQWTGEEKGRTKPETIHTSEELKALNEKPSPRNLPGEMMTVRKKKKQRENECE